MLLSPPPPPPAFQAAGRAAIPRRVAEAAPPVLDRGCFSPSPGVRAVVAGGVERRKRGWVGGEWYGGTRRGGERQKSGYRFSLFPSLERFGEEQNAVRPCYALVCWPLDAADAADEGKRTQRSGSTTIAWRKRSEGGFPLHPSH